MNIKKATIFFATDSTRLFLPWMSMLMSFIAVLIIAGGMTLYGMLTSWQQAVSGTLTIQIPTYTNRGESRGETVAREVETVLTILRSSPGVLGATVLSDEQMKILMTPWLGAETSLSELPIPKLIDVSLDSDNPPVLANLQKEIEVQVPVAKMDSHRMQLEPLLKLSNGIVQLIGFILILLGLTASFTVIYATRSSLTAHEHVIALTHLIGANDSFITRQYATRNFLLTLGGAFFGFVLSLPIMAGVSFFIRGANLAHLFESSFQIGEWSILILVPFVLAMLAFFTTIRTVMNYLKRFL